MKKKQFSFGLKLNFKEKKRDPDLNHIELLHNTEGHNKYYVLSLTHDKRTGISQQFPFVVVITYGKVGTLGGTLTHKFAEKHLAHDFMNKRMQEKLKKGYKRMI